MLQALELLPEKHHAMQHCTIALIGNRPRTTVNTYGDRLGYKRADRLGAHCTLVTRIIAPGNERHVGFGQIVTTQPCESARAEGIILQRANSAMFLQTADCPTVVIENATSGHVLATHAGRAALTPHDGQNIITNALDLIAPADDLDALNVYITGAICGAHFAHQHDDAQQLALPFLEEYGPEVFYSVDTLSLDLVAVIRTQLIAAGLTDQQIVQDNLCTYATPVLTSHRRDGTERTTANTVVVVKH